MKRRCPIAPTSWCCVGAASAPGLLVAAMRSAADADLDYPSVDAAFRAAKADPQAVVSTEQDWVVFTDAEPGGRTTTWRFTRPGHPAHPSVIRRISDEASGAAQTSMLCESRVPAACAALRHPANQ